MDNHLEFAEDGSIVISKSRKHAIDVNKGLAKLKMNAVAEILSWVEESNIHSQFVAWLGAF